MDKAEQKFVEGLGDLIVGGVRVLRGTAGLLDDDERRQHGLALRYIARTLFEEAERLALPPGHADAERRDAIRADFYATVRRPRVMQ